MKKLFTFKNLLGVIFIIVIIIVPLVTKDKETINIFYFFVGIIFIAMFYRTKDDSNSFLIHLFEQKEKQIEISIKAIKLMDKELRNFREENNNLKNVENKFLREELNRFSAENLELKKILEVQIDNEQLELAKQYLKNRSLNPRSKDTQKVLLQHPFVVSLSDVNGVLDLMINGEFLGFHKKFKEMGNPDFQ